MSVALKFWSYHKALTVTTGIGILLVVIDEYNSLYQDSYRFHPKCNCYRLVSQLRYRDIPDQYQ